MRSTATKIVSALIFSLVWQPHTATGRVTCLDVQGEATIVGDDVPAAKAEAISRAKLAAVEKSIGVEVKAQSVVQNMVLVDEAISREINGSVTSYRLLAENRRDGVLFVAINACVEPARARDAVTGLAKNNAVSVFILTRGPHGRGERYRESGIVADTLIGALAGHGVTVTDAAFEGPRDRGAVESALKGGKLLGLRSLMHRSLANLALVGKVDYAVSTKKGEDAGYGIAMPFTHVTARLTYRLVSKGRSGDFVVVAAGTGEGKGVANTEGDAAAGSLRDLAENLAPTILEAVEKHLRGVSKKVEVRVSGVSGLSDTFAVKEAIQGIAWVTSVEEKGLGEFTVAYPENTIYLANSLRQKGDFTIQSFTPDTITVAYRGSTR